MVVDFFETALGLVGPEDVASIVAHSANVKVVNCTHIGTDHSDYKHEMRVYNYIKDELDGNPHNQFFTL